LSAVVTRFSNRVTNFAQTSGIVRAIALNWTVDGGFRHSHPALIANLMTRDKKKGDDPTAFAH
jgi:hypothetical protein